MDKTLTKNILKVVFDFDNTLFDAERAKFLFRDIARANGYNEDEAKEIYRVARNDESGVIAITLERFLMVLKDRLAKDAKIFNENDTDKIIAKLRNSGSGLLLPGAQNILEFCLESGLDHYLLSLGVKSWQMEKISWVGIDEYFDKDKMIFTVKENGGKREALFKLFGDDFNGKNTILFNDRPDESLVLMDAFKELKVFLRIDERDTRYKAEDFKKLKDKFGDRIFLSSDLKILLGEFKNLCTKAQLIPALSF